MPCILFTKNILRFLVSDRAGTRTKAYLILTCVLLCIQRDNEEKKMARMDVTNGGKVINDLTFLIKFPT